MENEMIFRVIHTRRVTGYQPVIACHSCFSSLNFRNPPSSDTQPFSTQADTHEQFTSMDDKSATEPPHPRKLK